MARARGWSQLDYIILLVLLMAIGCYAGRILLTPDQTESNIRTFSTVRSVQRRASGRIDPTVLQRGNVYAINVHDNTFKLIHVDLDTLQLQNLYSSDSLSAHIRSSYPTENVGWAWYADTYAEDGWYRLEIRIDQDAPFPHVLKARAAGFVEGNLQGQHMYRYWTNYRVNEYAGRSEAPSQKLYDWFDEQYGWMTKRVHKATGWTLAMLRGEDPAISPADVNKPQPANTAEEYDSNGSRYYWTIVGLVAAQFEGLAAGFWASVVEPTRNMTWHELYAMNAVGDLYELNVLFPPTAQPSTEAAGTVAAGAAVVGDGRWYRPGHGVVGPYGYGEELDCSAIIKIDVAKVDDDDDEPYDDGDDEGEEGVAPGQRGAGEASGTAVAESVRRERQKWRVRNFWASHNTWRPYYDMVRTWKVYDLPWSATGALTVSSSPGLLHSKDDWYTTDAFVVMETTNGIYNKDLYNKIQSKCVLMWQRAQVANFGARRGDEWVDLFGRSNSGTYNNQWMVLDVRRLRRYKSSGVLWVLEQVPGKVVSKDASKVLYEQGYWASYNVPYFPEIYNLTGYPQPSIYGTCPRARLFSREQVDVTSRTALMSLMRLNRYQFDPLSLGLPNNAIAARYDLPAAPNPDGTERNWTCKAYGAVDAKVVDLESFIEGRTYVINGPTSTDQPPFVWSTNPAFANIRREGCVDRFDFGWQAYESVVGSPRSGAQQPMAS